MIVAGLTGGIATGKSTVSDFFSAAGAQIIDADRIAREVVEKGKPAWREITAHFGQDILLPDGEIDRQRLGDIIFSAPKEKQILNRIVHPHVFREMETQRQQIQNSSPDAIVIQDVPLLIESGMHKHLKPVIVVYVPEKFQLERLMKRDNISEAAARARIAAQMPIEEKKKQADIVIDNSGSREQTRTQTLKIYRCLEQQQAMKSHIPSDTPTGSYPPHQF
ncbi:dephospho-CoA kinase [Desulfonema ishimotonii]|uniref:Dephospho-CoA kinase n=1 Tax=Desulfonema ishimotonii TaxID=45657 RepID=A0A401FV91_9BACT|nr:dephospho-CoA kinase [Desulfonema ishimotonii]GBC60864.1 dephospho-CoA kinase [Desulfonema ishimotonii]